MLLAGDTGDRLRDAINDVLEQVKRGADEENDSPKKEELDYYDASSIKSAAEKFEIVLSAELQILDAYFVTQKGGYSSINLIEYGETLIPEGIRKDMSAKALADFKQGCRCLAFELSTAVGFHLVRAVEAVLHSYYDAVAVRKNAQVNWTMGTYTHNLKNNGGDSKVIGVLEQLTRLHRNPLMHPEDVLTTTQALILTGIATSAICSMIEGIQAKRAATPTLVSPALPVAASGNN